MLIKKLLTRSTRCTHIYGSRGLSRVVFDLDSNLCTFGFKKSNNNVCQICSHVCIVIFKMSLLFQLLPKILQVRWFFRNFNKRKIKKKINVEEKNLVTKNFRKNQNLLDSQNSSDVATNMLNFSANNSRNAVVSG